MNGVPRIAPRAVMPFPQTTEEMQAYVAEQEKLQAEAQKRYEEMLHELARHAYHTEITNIATSLFATVLMQELPKLMRAGEFDRPHLDVQAHVDECLLIARMFVESVGKLDPSDSLLQATKKRLRGAYPGGF